MRGQIIGIDAGNTRTGGGLTYLSEMIRGAAPEKCGIERVVVWGNSAALATMPERRWLKLIHEPAHDGAFYHGFRWQARKLGFSARAEKCDLLFFPGSTYVGNFAPFVAMSQNMLPFSPTERARFGWSWTRMRLKILQFSQATTFQRATGLIFLSQWAKLGIESYLHRQYSQFQIIPHGISERFRRPVRTQLPLQSFSLDYPFRWLYVSIVAPYKHQWHVGEAVAELRLRGMPVTVDFVGPAEPDSLKRLKSTMRHFDPEGQFLRYHGTIPYHELHKFYHSAHGFLFASTCENLPNILIEAMSASLPIACSRAGPMPEVLGDGGLYFDPENIGEMVDVMERLCGDAALRARCAITAERRASVYSWERCADETFSYLATIASAKK
jgi:glycosyltransferase involved in cell wall biosynthesis